MRHLRAVTRSRHTIAPLLIILLGIIVSVFIFFFVRTWEQSETQRLLDLSAINRLSSFHTEIMRHQEVVNSIADLISTKPDLTRSEFRSFVQRSLSRFPEIQALGWDPLVMNSERESFVNKNINEGFTNFHISEVNSKGQLVKAATREEYVVVNYMEPMKGNEKAFGFDIASHPGRLKAIQEARDTGEAIITGRVKLVQEKENKFGYLMIKAIYSSGDTPGTVEERRKRFTGVSAGVFRFSDAVFSIMKDIAPLGIDVWIRDLSAPAAKQFLYFHSSRTRQVVFKPIESDRMKAMESIHMLAEIDILGRKWSFLFAPAPKFFQEHSRWYAWSSIVLVLVITLLSALFSLSRSQNIIRLAQVNLELHGQIKGRELAERLRQKSEEQYRLAMKVTQDGLWDWDIANEIVTYSPGWGRILDLDTVENNYAFWEERIHPDDKTRIENSLKNQLSGESTTWKEEYRLRKHDGTWLWVYGRGQVIERDSQGSPLRMLGTMTDISLQKKAEGALREKKEFSDSLIDTAQTIIMVLDVEGKIVSFNSYMEQLSGYSLSEVQEKDWFDTFLPKRDRIKIRELFLETVINTLTIGNINPIVTKDGDEHLIEWNAKTLKNSKGDVIGLLSTGQDITEKKQTEQKLQLAANVFSNTREGIMVTDADVKIIEVNDSFERITGYSRKEILGENPSILQSGRQDNEFYAAMWNDLSEKNHWSGELWNRRKDGSFFAENLTINIIRDVQGNIQNYVGLFSDITLQKKHQQQLEYIAHHDSLTTLPNRALLIDRLQQTMAQSRRRRQQIAIAYLDLDGFKKVNDTYGHNIGDQLLVELASRLKHILREGDTIARLGGDEFVALLLDLSDTSESVPFLERMLSVTSEPVYLDDLILNVSSSIGVTYYPQLEDIDGDKLLRQADQAMYQAKLAGKNHFHVFDAEYDRNLRGRHTSLQRIREALSENEFVLYYQPKVNMRTGKMISAEALIRWQHPEQGLLSPNYFLPVIENDPLALELDQWVLETALKQMERWQVSGLNIPLSVNISANLLDQHDTVECMKVLLANHETIKPNDLILEILESTALEDMEHVVQIIRGCIELGINFSLDDFGTGYSSLTYLKRLPVIQLKIDQSFVRNMLDDPNDLSILVGVLDLARAFRLETVIEGVETVEHIELLLRVGCELVQGYAIAKPMPSIELVEWSATWKPDESWELLQPMYRTDFPLLFASIDHRAWIRNLEEYFRGERTVPPPVNHHQCRFGQWLYEEGIERFSSQVAFQTIVTLHKQIHTMALELYELKNNGQESKVIERLNDLYTLRDNLLMNLHELQKTSEQKALHCDTNELFIEGKNR